MDEGLEDKILAYSDFIFYSFKFCLLAKNTELFSLKPAANFKIKPDVAKSKKMPLNFQFINKPEIDS